jgi:hypothetical protein
VTIVVNQCGNDAVRIELEIFRSELFELVEIDVVLDPVFVAFGKAFLGQRKTNFLTACRM